jgi:hypothetical protein
MLGFSEDQLRAIQQLETDDDVVFKTRSEYHPAVYLLALEGSSTPDPAWGLAETALDAVVQLFQPSPAISHVELFIPKNNSFEDSNFATYIGCQAGWGKSFGGQRNFYLGRNASLWRAVPIAARDASDRVRTEACGHEGTPYSLARYAMAVPPFRAFSGMLPNGVGAPAHCATLSARILQRALQERAPAHASGWYGPSTLFLEMESKANTDNTRQFLENSITSTSSDCSPYEETQALHTLLGGSDQDVAALTDAQATRAVSLLTERALQPGLDATGRRIVQRQLATALLRNSIVRK